jgi:5-methylcytosine-specific restriction endonuclease McrA
MSGCVGNLTAVDSVWSNSADFRSIVLHGANVASYKFALAKSVLTLAEGGAAAVTLEELAVPFSKEICDHLQQVDTQSTSSGSRFLDACRHYNAGRITEEELVSTTALLGFNNVIDAFHVVDRTDVSTRFFTDERQQSLRGIKFTDELLALATQPDARHPLEAEAESRWRLVESAWHERRATGSTLRVIYDRPNETIVRGMLGHRRSITWVRPSLSGYQAGACFYCGTPITPLLGVENSADVDHYFPHMLMSRGVLLDLDGVWNLVLACPVCNRGTAGKFDRLPHGDFLETLWQRNERLINSHHPLRESIINTTGATAPARLAFLRSVQNRAIEHARAEWRPPR